MAKRVRHAGIILLVASALLLVFVRAAAELDFQRVKNGKTPILTFSSDYLSDGGSFEYVGLGYVVTCLHRKEWHSREITYRKGTLLNFWVEVPLLLSNQDASVKDTSLSSKCKA